MAVVPAGTPEKLAFFETRLPVWAADAEGIGLSAAQIAELTALTVAARNAYNAAITARAAARAATQAQNDAIGAMAGLGGDLVKTIRAFAQTTDDPAVFAAAQIPAPRPKTPLGPAPTPTNLTAELTNSGGIRLRWTASSRGRTGFVIERRLTRQGEIPGAWSLIGTSVAKSFTDNAVPTGLESAQYRVTAERPGGRSEPTEPIVVLFGTAAPSGDNGELRIAA